MPKPFVTWTADMSVGVQALDDDHMKLVAILNDLHDGIAAGRGTARLGKVLDGLVSHAKTHFALEEELFAQTGYPAAADHIREHREFTEWVLDIHAHYNKGLFDALSQNTLNFLKDWLRDHVLDSDKKYEAHLRANGIH